MDSTNRVNKNEYARNWNAKNRDRVNARRRERYASNKELREKIKAQTQEWKQNNPEKAKASIAQWKSKNKDKIKEYARAWRQNNKDKIKIHKQNALGSRYNSNRKRRGKLKQNQTPSWANIAYINTLYKMAKRRSFIEGRSYHVDHIIPLNSNLVSGLHVENNLQIILAKDNLQKGSNYND